MQASFLSLCAGYIVEKCRDNWPSACIVFPTRRAALFFRKELARHISKPVFAPEILSVNDFVEALSPVKTTDYINLLFKLFRSCKQAFPQETFYHYFHWGEMLLRDFNEIDLECPDAGKLFAAIKDWKDLESRFEWEAEELAAIQKFWSGFSMQNPGILLKSFLDSWQSIPAIYKHFHESALNHSFASEGLVWKHACNSVKAQSYTLKWNQIFFCGFYFITRLHQQLVSELKKKANVEFLYDADSYYTDDPFQEAGWAFRKHKSFTNFKGNYFSSHPKSITITGVTRGEMQVKAAGQIIHEWMKEESDKSTAIILPDEKLLLPLLNSLPESVKTFNVTMGFPAHLTVTGSFIRTLYDLHTGGQVSAGKWSSLRLVQVLTHPGIPEEFKSKAAVLHKEILQSQILWLSDRTINQSGLANLILYAPRNADGVIHYLLELLEKIAQTESVLESSVAMCLHEKLSEIRPEILELAQEMDDGAAWKIVMKIIRTVRIPFSGEPVSGIQIMGMLETRALDFDRIIMLSVNEGLLPGPTFYPTMIPYALRKAFGMPVADQHDAVYAYHFYRLLQRAGEVHLIYDTEGKQYSGGEMSRFITQLMSEAEQKSGGLCKVVHRIMTAPLTVMADEKIEIRKSQQMMEEFRKKVSESEGGLSASAITTYMACTLRFYFRYIAGLKEPEELSEMPGPEVLGNLLHHAMEFLYGNKKHVTSTDIQSMKGESGKAVDAAFKKIFRQESPEVTGYHFLNKQIVQRLVLSVLDTDASRTPFTIEGLERNIQAVIAGGMNARGVIDRLQRKNGVLEILDYKSGKAELTTDPEKVFSDTAYKASFQIFYYAMLVRKELKDIPLRAGLYVMKQLSGGIAFLNKGEPLGDEMLNEFESRLQKMIDDMMNPALSFEQTSDTDQCRYCPYSAICKR